MSNQTTNLYQVIKEEDLNEILEDNIRKLVVIMFSSKDCIPCMNILPKFVETAEQKLDCFFVYINIHKYTDTSKKYTEKLKCTPRFAYYYNKQELAYVLGQNEKVFIKTLNDLIFRIKEKKEEIRRRNLMQTTSQYRTNLYVPLQPVQQQSVVQQQPIQQQTIQQQPMQQQPIQQQMQQQMQQQPIQQQPIQQQAQQ